MNSLEKCSQLTQELLPKGIIVSLTVKWASPLELTPVNQLQHLLNYP